MTIPAFTNIITNNDPTQGTIVAILATTLRVSSAQRVFNAWPAHPLKAENLRVGDVVMIAWRDGAAWATSRIGHRTIGKEARRGNYTRPAKPTDVRWFYGAVAWRWTDKTHVLSYFEIEAYKDRNLPPVLPYPMAAGRTFHHVPEVAGLYYWRVRAVEEHGVPSDWSEWSALIGDIRAPGPVTEFAAIKQENKVKLTWKLPPGDLDISAVSLRFFYTLEEAEQGGVSMPLAVGAVETFTFALKFPEVRAVYAVVIDHARNESTRSPILLIQALQPTEFMPWNGNFEAGVEALPDNWIPSYPLVSGEPNVVWPWYNELDFTTARSPELTWDTEFGLGIEVTPVQEYDVPVLLRLDKGKCLRLDFNPVPGDSEPVLFRWLASDGLTLPALEEVYPYINYELQLLTMGHGPFCIDVTFKIYLTHSPTSSRFLIKEITNRVNSMTDHPVTGGYSPTGMTVTFTREQLSQYGQYLYVEFAVACIQGAYETSNVIFIDNLVLWNRSSDPSWLIGIPWIPEWITPMPDLGTGPEASSQAELLGQSRDMVAGEIAVTVPPTDVSTDLVREAMHETVRSADGRMAAYVEGDWIFYPHGTGVGQPIGGHAVLRRAVRNDGLAHYISEVTDSANVPFFSWKGSNLEGEHGGRIGYDGYPGVHMDEVEGYPVKQVRIDAECIIGGVTGGDGTAGVASDSSVVGGNTTGTEFDPDEEQAQQWAITMPESWEGGTFSCKFLWTAASGSGSVVWGIQAAYLGEGGSLGVTWGTAVEITDTLAGAGELSISATINGITPSGTMSEDRLVLFRVYRKAADGSDTLDAVASLLMARITFS